MVTIKEIASELGLSSTTVSNVIHGKTSEVSPETIERVREFLDEVGYIPNISARNLARNSSQIIGLVLKTQNYAYENILADPFVSEMVSGIEEAVRSAGFMLMLCIFSTIRELLRGNDVPKAFEGNPIAFIIAAIMALAFSSLSGLV